MKQNNNRGRLVYGTTNPKKAARIEAILFYHGVKYSELYKFVENVPWSGFYQICTEPVPKWIEAMIRRDIKEIKKPKTLRTPNKFGGDYVVHL